MNDEQGVCVLRAVTVLIITANHLMQVTPVDAGHTIHIHVSKCYNSSAFITFTASKMKKTQKSGTTFQNCIKSNTIFLNFDTTGKHVLTYDTLVLHRKRYIKKCSEDSD